MSDVFCFCVLVPNGNANGKFIAMVDLLISKPDVFKSANKNTQQIRESNIFIYFM